MNRTKTMCACLTVALLAAVASGGEVTLRTSSGIKIQGELKSVSGKGIVLVWANREKKYAWHELAPLSVYEIRKSRIDAKDAQAHFDLGDYCAGNDLPKLAKEEYELSLKLDKSLEEKVKKAIAAIRARTDEAPKPEKAEKPAPEPEKEPAKKPAEGPARKPADPTAAKPGEAAEPNAAEMLKAMQEDPVKYEQEWIALQRMHMKEVEEKLGLKFYIHETDHYILHSTMNANVTRQVANGCEDLYKKMSKAFGVRKGDLLWAGKCMVHLFDNRNQFTDFAAKIDGFSAANAGGYFSHRGRLVHIAIPKSEGGEKGFEATLIHEGAHAFLQLFKEDIFIKPWIHEGVAQYFENRCFPDGMDWQAKRNIVRTGRRLSLHSLRKAESFLEMDPQTMNDYYAYSWSALDFMIRANPKDFVKFIHVLKGGKSEEEAIQEAFGKNMDDFEKAWMAYARKSF